MKFSLRKIRINQGGYDDSGRYYGVGRADDRQHAKEIVRYRYPAATFYN